MAGTSACVVVAQLSLCTDVDSQLCTSTDPDLSCLVVTSNGDVSHGAVKSDSLMGVVVRDQARRGQPVAKPMTQPMPDLDRESHREKDREMLARLKEFDGDVDIDIGIESISFTWRLIKSLIRSLIIVLRNRDECCDENRHENRFERGFEFKFVFESRFKGRFEYGFERVFKCVYTQSEKAVSELWEISLVSTTAIARRCACRLPTPVLL